jgi:hypothetical protein
MAINTSYAAFQAAVADWLNRTDLTSQIPDFIALVEARLLRTLRGKRAVVRTGLSLDSASVSLPAGIKELRSVYLTGSTFPGPIDIVTPEKLAYYGTGHSAAARPRYGALVNGTLVLSPTPDTSYAAEIVYEAELPALSAGVNWLLQYYPDVYLYGTLTEAATFLRDDDRIPGWTARFASALQELELDRDRAEYGANTPVIHPSRSF